MKRIVAAAFGYALGLASAAYVRRRTQRAVERVAPERLRADLAAMGSDLAAHARATVERARETVSEAVGDLRAAAAEGMDSMRAADSELKAEFGADAAAHNRTPRGLDPTSPAAGGFRPRH